jgi:hypothetical protein
LFGATTLPTTTLLTDLASPSPALTPEKTVATEPTVVTEPTATNGQKVIVDNSNVLLPYEALLDFQTESFCCRHCHAPLTKSLFEKVQVTFATSINYYCTCKKVSSLQAKTKSVLGTDGRYKHEQTRAVPHLVSDYSINNQIVLAMQQLGCGQAGAAVLGGMLSVTPNAFHNTFSDIEVQIGKHQIAAGNSILEDNVEKEKQLSEVNDDSQFLFCVSIDNGWNNRGSGHSYNSDSSHHITVGNRSGLVVALHYMSKRCTRCELAKKRKLDEKKVSDTQEDDDEEVTHDPAECPMNYLGSSKGMEAHGALKSCIHLHSTAQVVYEIIVMDDDSSTENILKWNFVEAFEADMIPSIPKTPAGNKKVDNGKLPLTHPPILRLANHNHRNRCMAGKFYNLARAAKKG